MPLIPTALLVKSKVEDLKQEFASNSNVADAIAQIVASAGGRVDLGALKRELAKPTPTNESRTITRNQIRRIVKEEIIKLR